MTITIQYCVCMGSGDYGDWTEWTPDLSEEEVKTFQKVVEDDLDINSCDELATIRERITNEIIEYEKENLEETGGEYDDNWDLILDFNCDEDFS